MVGVKFKQANKLHEEHDESLLNEDTFTQKTFARVKIFINYFIF